MKKVMLVFGTRPEAIKMCPLINELKIRVGIQTVVCITGQHRQMLNQVLEVFKVIPDYALSIMKDRQTLFDVINNILSKIEGVLDEVKPDVVLVHGDTSTTFATALACFYKQIPIGHVEAGLRTYDLYSPYPEEFNRQAVSIISRFNFAPTQRSADNLKKEGKAQSTIYITGNTAIDALQTTVRDNFKHEILDWGGNSRLIVITAYRRENLGEPMHQMFRAIKRIMVEHPDVKAVYPIHMNPAVRQIAEWHMRLIHMVMEELVRELQIFLSMEKQKFRLRQVIYEKAESKKQAQMNLEYCRYRCFKSLERCLKNPQGTSPLTHLRALPEPVLAGRQEKSADAPFLLDRIILCQ